VLKLQYKNVSVLFTGDIEKAAEADLMEKLPQKEDILKSLILKVPHHGSDSSLADDFLKLVKPCISIVSVGTGNKFGHPSEEIIKKLEDYGRVYRTDYHGAVIINSDGINNIRIKSQLQHH